MAAIIKTIRNGDAATAVVGASRDDLRPGDVVTCTAVDPALTAEGYRWTLAFTPEALDGSDSSASLLSPPGELDDHCKFVIDNEGAYLIRLITDPGTEHESTQFVRLRFLTKFGSLKLLAAGERRDGTGIIPVDASTEGWANDQNYNLQELLHHISRTAISSRVLYVDSNRGNDYSNNQNTEEAEDYGDFWKIQDAIDSAVAGGHCGVPATDGTPWMIIVRPGRYVETLQVPQGIHLIGGPHGSGPLVDLETDGQGSNHVFELAGGMSSVSGIVFRNNDGVPTSGLLHVHEGDLRIRNCRLLQESDEATTGPCISMDEARVWVNETQLESIASTSAERFVLTMVNGSGLRMADCSVKGASGILSTGERGEIRVVDSIIEANHGDADTVCIRSWGAVSVLRSSLFAQNTATGSSISVNPDGTGSTVPIHLAVTHSTLLGDLRFDTTNQVDAPVFLSSVGVDPTRIKFLPSEADVNLTHFTAGESLAYWAEKELHESSLFTGPIPADSVQEALDRILNLAISVVTLDDAYDGIIDHGTNPPTRGEGHGNKIVADALGPGGEGIPVQIVDKEAPDATAVMGKTRGRLQVVSNIEVGAIDAPEINLDPNPFGMGPLLGLGQTVWPGGGHLASATIRAKATDAGFNYNLRLQAQSSNEDSAVGSVHVEGAPSTHANHGGGHVLLQGGSGLQGGSVALAPGLGASMATGDPDAGSIWLMGAGTPASITAGGAFVGLEAGELILGTPHGTAVVDVLATDALADVLTKINASPLMTAVDDGGFLKILAGTQGQMSDVWLVSCSTAALNTALGDLTAAAVTRIDGKFTDLFAVQVQANHEVAFGTHGAVGPMVYNSETGKLTVPGLIDPWGMIFKEVDHTLADEAGIHPQQGEGGVFVSDGTGGLVDNHPYYRGEADGGGVEQDPVAFVLSDGSGNATEVAFWSADGVLGGDENLWWDSTNGRLGVNNPAPTEALDVDGNANITGNMVVGGDLTIQGSTTTLNTQTVTVEDKNIELGTVDSGVPTDVTADGGGLTLLGDTNKTLTWDMATGAWHFNQNLSTVGSVGTLTLDSEGSLAGNMGLWADGSHLVVGSKTNNDFFVFLNDAETLQITRGASWTAYTSHGGTGDHYFVGKVGIGLNNPSAALEVVGGLVADEFGPIASTGNISAESGGKTLTLDVEGVHAGTASLVADGSHLGLRSVTGNDLMIYLQDAETLQITRSGSFVRYTSHGGGGSHSFAGQVSIGTDTPTLGKALTVDGDVKITGVLDPTALVITNQADGPPLAEGETALWVDEAGALKVLRRLEGDPEEGVADTIVTASEAGAGIAAGNEGEVQVSNGAGGFVAATGLKFDAGPEQLTVPGSVVRKRTTVIAPGVPVVNNYHVVPSDYYIGADTSDEDVVVWLPIGQPPGRELVIKNEKDANNVIVRVGTEVDGAVGFIDNWEEITLSPFQGLKVLAGVATSSTWFII